MGVTTYECSYCGASERIAEGFAWTHPEHPATYTITATTTHHRP